MKDRRTVEGYRLRTYIDALKDARSISDQEWVVVWASKAGPNEKYISRSQWIAYLEHCVMAEAFKISEWEAA